jgi:hypothetical protein
MLLRLQKQDACYACELLAISVCFLPAGTLVLAALAALLLWRRRRALTCQQAARKPLGPADVLVRGADVEALTDQDTQDTQKWAR